MFGHHAFGEKPFATGTGPPAAPVIPSDQVVVQSTRLSCPDLELLLPDINFRIDDTGELRAFIVDVLQPVLELLCTEAQRYVDQNDVDLADEDTVDAMLRDLGNPFEGAFALELNRKRLLVRNLVDIYKTKGVEPGLVNVIRALTGIEATVISPGATFGWILGESVLSDTASDPPAPEVTDLVILGPSLSFVRYSFELQVDRVLTQVEKDQITAIVDLIKPAHTHFLGFIEPEVPLVIDHWELGLSFLHETGEPLVGDEIDLHE